MRDPLLAAVRGLRHRRGVAATVVLTLTLAIVPALLAAVALGAALVPARRAAALDPTRALRED